MTRSIGSGMTSSTFTSAEPGSGLAILPGTPTTVAPGGTDRTTTDPAPTFAPFPIRIGPRIIAPDPRITSSSMVGCRLIFASAVPPSTTPM